MLQKDSKCFCGMDLHSNNTVIAILDETGKKIFKAKLPNKLETILKALQPFKDNVCGIVVESTYNWYWLVDGLMEHDYKLHLAHPASNQQYKGLKHTNDVHDAFWLADLLRLGILKEGHIFPKQERYLRDLVRKRLKLVYNRTQYILSFKSLVNRHLGVNIDSNNIKKLTEAKVNSMFKHDHLISIARENIVMMRFLGKRIKLLEDEILKAAYLKPEFLKLRTVQGIGFVLAITIAVETGNIDRFKEAGNYVSYSRCVGSKRISNKKGKGQNNRKNGNKYLAWAYVEAAHKLKRYCSAAMRYYTKKSKKTKPVVASKALAAKIARACYFIMKDRVDFDVTKIFGKPINSNNKDKGCGSKSERGLDKEPCPPIDHTATAA
jgi:transposase